MIDHAPRWQATATQCDAAAWQWLERIRRQRVSMTPEDGVGRTRRICRDARATGSKNSTQGVGGPNCPTAARAVADDAAVGRRGRRRAHCAAGIAWTVKERAAPTLHGGRRAPRCSVRSANARSWPDDRAGPADVADATSRVKPRDPSAAAATVRAEFGASRRPACCFKGDARVARPNPLCKELYTLDCRGMR